MDVTAPLDHVIARFARRVIDAIARYSRRPYLEFMFTGMGRIAKSTGKVSSRHIHYADAVMQRLDLDGRARKEAIQWFVQGRDERADFHQLAARCTGRTIPALARMTIESFVAIAEIEPSSTANRTLHFLASLIGADAASVQGKRRVIVEQRQALDTARHILGVAPDADLDTQKRAYRQLTSRYHPDKLPTNATLQEREYAVQRTIEIRTAWETLQDASATNWNAT